MAETPGASKTNKAFEVDRSNASVSPSRTNEASAANAVKPSAALEGVRNGSLDARAYVDAKVNEATEHLAHLSPTQLATVKSVVREQLLSDPHLAELVQQATGHAAPTPDE